MRYTRRALPMLQNFENTPKFPWSSQTFLSSNEHFDQFNQSNPKFFGIKLILVISSTQRSFWTLMIYVMITEIWRHFHSFFESVKNLLFLNFSKRRCWLGWFHTFSQIYQSNYLLSQNKISTIVSSTLGSTDLVHRDD